MRKFSERAVPLATEMDDAFEKTKRVLTSKLPLFAMHRAVAQGFRANSEPMHALMNQYGFELRGTSRFDSTGKGMARDLYESARGLHSDAYEFEADEVLTVNLYEVMHGKVGGVFIPLRRFTITPLSNFVDFDKGRINESVFEPVVYRIEATADTMIVFPLDGKGALAHDFPNLEEPRFSEATYFDRKG